MGAKQQIEMKMNKTTNVQYVNNSAYSIFYKGEHIQFTYGNMVPVGGVHRHRIYS